MALIVAQKSQFPLRIFYEELFFLSLFESFQRYPYPNLVLPDYYIC